jgi:hypothetical protein
MQVAGEGVGLGVGVDIGVDTGVLESTTGVELDACEELTGSGLDELWGTEEVEETTSELKAEELGEGEGEADELAEADLEADELMGAELVELIEAEEEDAAEEDAAVEADDLTDEEAPPVHFPKPG